MGIRRCRTKSIPLFSPGLLTSRSKELYQKFHAAFEHEVAPRNIVETMYVAEIAFLSWRMLRLHRAEAGMISAAFEPALLNLLMPVSGYIQVKRDFLQEGGS